MRRFAATGWLNFRMRAMIVSSACHVLHLNWRTILWSMARLMAVYIPGIHNSQTQAGVTGINTFRISKPAKQLTHNEQSPIAGYIPPIVDYATHAKAMRAARDCDGRVPVSNRRPFAICTCVDHS